MDSMGAGGGFRQALQSGSIKGPNGVAYSSAVTALGRLSYHPLAKFASTVAGGGRMARRQKDPLLPLTQNARMCSQRADLLTPAKALLAVADGASFTEAAIATGRKSADAVAHLVARFNWEGLAALEPRHGGGPPRKYQVEARERILKEFPRTIADLDDAPNISVAHLAEALQYRQRGTL